MASNRQELIRAWHHEEQVPFAGWDFSYLDGRMIAEQPPWSYASRAADLMDGASSMLDMGTGGGGWPLPRDTPVAPPVLQEQLERGTQLVSGARKYLVEARK